MTRPAIGSKGPGGTVLLYYGPTGEPIYGLPARKAVPNGRRQGRRPKPTPGTDGTVGAAPAPRGGHEADNKAALDYLRRATGDDDGDE